MTARRYARDRINRRLVEGTFPDAFRIIPGRHIGTPLGTSPSGSRFVARSAGYEVLYAASDFATAFAEAVLRDRFVGGGLRRIELSEVAERAWVRLGGRSGVPMTLLDLRGDGCMQIGAPTDAVGARNHAAGRALGRAIHAENDDVDGLIYASRLITRDVYAVYGRSVHKLEVRDYGWLRDHPELPDVLGRFDVQLLR